jgi:hypothetical protein
MSVRACVIPVAVCLPACALCVRACQHLCVSMRFCARFCAPCMWGYMCKYECVGVPVYMCTRVCACVCISSRYLLIETSLSCWEGRGSPEHGSPYMGTCLASFLLATEGGTWVCWTPKESGPGGGACADPGCLGQRVTSHSVAGVTGPWVPRRLAWSYVSHLSSCSVLGLPYTCPLWALYP